MMEDGMNERAADEALATGAANPREIDFDLNGRRFTFDVPAPGELSIRSVFLIGLPKAGSTLLARLMEPITASVGLAFVALQQTMFDMGVPSQDIPPRVNDAFQPYGYAFGGFRTLPGA